MLLAFLALSVSAAAQETLLALDLTVDGKPARLVLQQGQSYVEAARLACAATTTPAATDTCVAGAVNIIVSQHLRVDEASARTLASPGVALMREALFHYDPVTYVGTSPLHVDIELPVQTKRTVCDDQKCWELEASDGVPATNHTLQVPAWVANASEAASQVASLLDLWRSEDLALIAQRVALERTRKATPVDRRLHRAADAQPVVSFDGFYPAYFVLHTSSLFFDAQRVKVAGSFRPPEDGDVCISVRSLKAGESFEDPAAEAPAEACFGESYNAQLAGTLGLSCQCSV